MIVVAIIGILAAVALPAYQDYTVRAKMSEAIGFAAAAKSAVSECIISSGGTDECDTLAQVGLDANITSDIVESITMTDGGGGAIVVAIQGTGSSMDSDGTLTFTPSYTEASGVQWSCSISKADYNKYVPQTCRST